MLIYGGPGTGKTNLCGTAPNPLIISAEAGLLTLRKRVGIPVIVVNNIDEVYEALTYCQTSAAAHGIQTVCLDSISEIVEKCLYANKQRTKDPRQAYGAMADDAIDLVKRFRDLQGLHVIITAKETSGADPLTGVPRAEPTAPGQQVGPAMPYLFDEVLHAFTATGPDGAPYWALRTKGSTGAIAKDRSGVLDEIEYPDASHLITKMLGA
jgi:hypothetical protein